MNFGSEFVLVEDDDEEVVDVVPSGGHYSSSSSSNQHRFGYNDNFGFECEIMDFDEDEPQTPDPAKKGKVNTNTTKIDFHKLTEAPDIILENTNLFICQSDDCGAAFSHLAKKNAEMKKWVCNFCGTENDISQELPNLTESTNDVMYLSNVGQLPELKPPEKSKQKIIFVIDTSSSMCQSKPLEINKASSTLVDIVKEETHKHQQNLLALGPAGAPSPALTVSSTFDVSRLQSVKASVIDVINHLVQNQKDVRVGLVAFHEYVYVYGDGKSSNGEPVQGNALNDIKQLKEIGLKYSDLCPLSESAPLLVEKIKSLTDDGRTALGPALVIAQYMASDAQGSKVILCTDGMANIGLGRLEETKPVDIDKFYNDVIADSTTLGVSVSLICVDNAGLDTRLGQVPTDTGGSLEKIEDVNLFGKIMEDFKKETVAVNATIKFIVHNTMYVSDHSKSDKDSQSNKLIGNLHLDRSFPFSFGFKPNIPDKQAKEPEAETAGNDQSLPFQTQIKYRTLSGATVSRVWTTERKITKNREQAEKTMDDKVVVESFIQSNAKILLDKIREKRQVLPTAENIVQSGLNLDKKLKDEKKRPFVKLTDFVSLMNKIIRNGSANDEHVKELTALHESRSGQGQG